MRDKSSHIRRSHSDLSLTRPINRCHSDTHFVPDLIKIFVGPEHIGAGYGLVCLLIDKI